MTYVRDRGLTAAVIGALVLLGAACGSAETGATPLPSTPAPVTSSASPSPTGPADAPAAVDAPAAPAVPVPGEQGRPTAVPVYFVAETPAGLRLYREFHRVVTADPVSEAVREMLVAPIDPDYRTAWPAGTRLLAPVVHRGGVIAVDLSAQARDGSALGSELAALTVQQLVFTVQGALQSTDPVRLLVEGRAVEELWGVVSTADPIERGDAYALRSLVQIDAPADGADVGRQVVVSGEAAVFEANVLWDVRRDGAVVRSGFTTADEGQRFSAFRFTVDLEPGEYEIRVAEDDPSGGEGRPPISDTKRVTVTG